MCGLKPVPFKLKPSDSFVRFKDGNRPVPFKLKPSDSFARFMYGLKPVQFKLTLCHSGWGLCPSS